MPPSICRHKLHVRIRAHALHAWYHSTGMLCPLSESPYHTAHLQLPVREGVAEAGEYTPRQWHSTGCLRKEHHQSLEYLPTPARWMIGGQVHVCATLHMQAIDECCRADLLCRLECKATTCPLGSTWASLEVIVVQCIKIVCNTAQLLTFDTSSSCASIVLSASLMDFSFLKWCARSRLKS